MATQTFGFVVLFICLSAASAEKKCTGTATYMIDFKGTWNSRDHKNFPSGARFSPLGGCSHNEDYTMWDANMKASAGVQRVAEKGNTSQLNYEIMMQIKQGNAYKYTEAEGFNAPGESKSYIRVSYEFPLVSLIGMIVPSSDWFVGVRKMELCGEDGNWKETVEMAELAPWDAGSAEGSVFNFSQTPSNPQQNIEIITKDNTDFGSSPIASLGKITLTRVCDGKQTYNLTFQGSWSKQDHPTDFPSAAHFSPLIGASHSGLYKFWEGNGKASPGVKSVAETGNPKTLRDELLAKKRMDIKYILQIIEGKSFGSPGQDIVKVEVDGLHSRVSVISMLAPSPDWFVGIDSFDLCNKWTWRNTAERGNLPPWDSGTDSGKLFQSSNEVTNPVGTIQIILNTEDSSFKSDKPTKSLGKFVFVRDYTPTMTPTGDKPSSGASGVKGYTAGLVLAAVLLAARAIL